MGYRLHLPLPLSLSPLRLLTLLRLLLLLDFLTLLRLLPFLSRVISWCMGWVWVSLLLLGLPLPASWHPTSAHPPDTFVPATPHASTDPLADEDERFPDDVHGLLDPSAPPLSLDSARSEYRRMIDYVCGLFLQAAGAPPSAPPPHAWFESFFAPVAPATPSINF